MMDEVCHQPFFNNVQQFEDTLELILSDIYNPNDLLGNE